MKAELMAHSGDDLLVIDAARASFGKESSWDKKIVDTVGSFHAVNVLKEKDKKLLNFLAREKHLLPFRHPQITLRCRAPIFIARQLGKHQTGMSWSEESRRYITTAPDFYWPDKWRKKADNVKQGSSDEAADVAVGPAKDIARWAISTYDFLLSKDVAPEQARMILPQNMMVTWVWTGSLLSFVHMYQQRSEATAQKEVRDFAELVREVVEPLYPVSWAALVS